MQAGAENYKDHEVLRAQDFFDGSDNPKRHELFKLLQQKYIYIKSCKFTTSSTFNG